MVGEQIDDDLLPNQRMLTPEEMTDYLNGPVNVDLSKYEPIIVTDEDGKDWIGYRKLRLLL